ncbi:MAG TPA: hypothetical protein VF053_02515 [Streptosporangiales bacterium]
MTIYPTKTLADAAVIERRVIESLRRQPLSDVHAVYRPDALGWVIEPIPANDPRIALRAHVQALNPWLISAGIDPVAAARGLCDGDYTSCPPASVEVSWSLADEDSDQARVCAGCAVGFVLGVLREPHLVHITAVVFGPVAMEVAA